MDKIRAAGNGERKLPADPGGKLFKSAYQCNNGTASDFKAEADPSWGI